MLKITLFIPVRNEIDGLKVIMPRILKSYYDEIIILDGNSSDGSREYLEGCGYHVYPQKTRGIKAAFWEGFDIATGDVVIPFSPDGNSIPEDIPRLVNKIQEGFDIVIASRYREKAKSEDDDLISGAANYFFTSLINCLYKSSFTDGIGMYKAFKKCHLYNLGLDKYKNEHSEIMLLTRGTRYGLRITEISSSEPKRIGVQGSRAHPGIFGKYKGAFILLKSILRDAFFYWPPKKRL